MRLAFIGHKVHRHGGMERAAAEVLERVAQKHDVVVLARECEVQAARLRWVPVPFIARPHLLLTVSFAHNAGRARASLGPVLVNAIGASAKEADVITAQFCHAAFQARFGGMRGGQGRLRQWYQDRAEEVFVRQERHAYTSPRLKHVIAVSEGVKRELMQYYHVPSDKISVIPNGVDHQVFRPAADAAAKRRLRATFGLPEEAFLCLFVGGDWDRKGLGDAIRAISRTPGALLVVVGKGDQARFQAVAVAAGVGERVIFCGPSERPQDHYAAADVFVFPSRYEAFSLVTIEAVASGLPVLALRINGTEELIEDGGNGFFVEGDPNSIAEKLCVLAQNPALRQAMSEAAVLSSRRYTWDQIAAEQLSIFEQAWERSYDGLAAQACP